MSLVALEQDIYQAGVLTREHLLRFLELQDTSDAASLRESVRTWLTKLHNDPQYSKIVFDPDHGATGFDVAVSPIQRVLDDLTNYGRVRPETIIDAPPPPDIDLAKAKAVDVITGEMQ